MSSNASASVSSSKKSVNTESDFQRNTLVAARAEKVNSHLQEKSTLKRSNKPCYAFFGNNRTCEKGDNCRFSHDVESYKNERGLKDCPNNCGRFCLETSNQCSGCVQEMYDERRRMKAQEKLNRKAQFDSMPEQKCQSHGKRLKDGTYEWE